MLAPPTDAEIAVAEALIDEALAGYEQTLPPSKFALLREVMLDRLLCTPSGRAKLTLLGADPIVTGSGELSTRAATAAEVPKKGVGGA